GISAYDLLEVVGLAFRLIATALGDRAEQDRQRGFDGGEGLDRTTAAFGRIQQLPAQIADDEFAQGDALIDMNQRIQGRQNLILPRSINTAQGGQRDVQKRQPQGRFTCLHYFV